MDETDGPFAGVIRNCITDADDEELRNCPFSVEFGITTSSLPVADSIDRIAPSKNEKFQYSQTCISGADDQRPTTATAVELPANVFAGEETAAGVGDGKEDQVRIDLGNDNGNLGLSKPREITVFEVEYSEGDIDEPLRKRIRICEKNLRMQSSITDLAVEEIVRDEVIEDNGENHAVDGKKHANGIKGSCTTGIDGSIKRRRELPLWMRGGENNGKVEDVGREAMKKGQFKDIIGVTMEVFGNKDGENKDADFFKTAKRRHMLFPRPRWWPPELSVD